MEQIEKKLDTAIAIMLANRKYDVTTTIAAAVATVICVAILLKFSH